MYPMLCEILGCPELGRDPRFATGRDRMGNLDTLIDLLNARFRQRTTAEWLERLEAAGIPSGPVLSIRDMLKHPQTRARDMVVAVDHPVAGRVETIGVPAKFSATPTEVSRPAPLFGQHTREVLTEAGFTSAEIDALFAEGAAKETPLPTATE
jgi:crotonobetainyl-CoA:carnitine CoA-transferase CaiB-like acyl-CoA transferase